MSQYEFQNDETANGSLNQLQPVWLFFTWIIVAILELILVPMPNFVDSLCEFYTRPCPGLTLLYGGVQ